MFEPFNEQSSFVKHVALLQFTKTMFENAVLS